MDRRCKMMLMIFCDFIVINLGVLLAFAIRLDGSLTEVTLHSYEFNTYVQNIMVISMIKIAVYYIFGIYKCLWRYASAKELLAITTTTFIGTCSVLTYMFLTKQYILGSTYILIFIFDILLVGGVRFLYRGISGYTLRKARKNKQSDEKVKNVLIIGGGDAGALLIREFKNNLELRSNPVGVIDDDKTKIGSYIMDVRILGGRDKIISASEELNVSEIIIAMPSLHKDTIRELVEIASKTKKKLRIIPGIVELVDGKISAKDVREVKIEDLLGREPNMVDMSEMTEYVRNRVVMVTGGGGSIGSELCRQITNFNPNRLIILDNYENNAYEIQNELLRKHPQLDLHVVIASVREKDRLNAVFNEHWPEIIFHAAAHKHVPLMEDNPSEAIKNNVLGTKNVVDCADKYGVKKFVLVSTDKAVNPTNIMGASKRLAELVIQNKNATSRTDYVAVRFGNVLGSNGSVIPLFKKQIAEGGPITVTHKDIIRYFMTIPEAVQLVMQAGAMATGGEIFVLDMGEPVKILTLAENLIKLSGFEPYEDIDIRFTGLRPGEKLFEELLMDSEGLEKTKSKEIFIEKPDIINELVLKKDLAELFSYIEIDDLKLVNKVREIVPSYKPNNKNFTRNDKKVDLAIKSDKTNVIDLVGNKVTYVT